ncbi:hypothetical protein BJX63DRAFT_148099 [Aspergillus granulosus]|uniref:Uncharacterized protein n=1 Tax=Aspergillus granulosus TaxID=176169 RepID=A0ABR4HLC7_9EURO
MSDERFGEKLPFPGKILPQPNPIGGSLPSNLLPHPLPDSRSLSRFTGFAPGPLGSLKCLLCSALASSAILVHSMLLQRPDYVLCSTRPKSRWWRRWRNKRGRRSECEMLPLI